MSETEDFSARPAEEMSSSQEPMAVLSSSEGQSSFREEMQSLDEQIYVLGEVPQPYLSDPQAFLPLDSDTLVGAAQVLDGLMTEAGLLVQEEIQLIQRLQKRINLWEDRIERNRAIIAKHETEIHQNRIDIGYDKKNRDYWISRAEGVMLDYQDAESANRKEQWGWLVKKYGLKNSDGEVLDHAQACIEELCNGEANNLAAEYKTAGNKYEQNRKDREMDNCRLIRENSALLHTNETLQSYISATYVNEVEPLQAGVLLLKELGVKLKGLSQAETATYGELRTWAEMFLNDFLKANPRVLLPIVTHFRRITSIPLPSVNS